MASGDGVTDEEIPLLQTNSRTPLPWNQLSLVFLASVAEPFSSTYIFPFINQLISELGITEGDDRKIGYYAGLIESLFFVTQASFIWRWSQLSDAVGRRPILLLGLLGLSVSNIAFGLSRTLSTLIISRCLAGLLNGNVGVMISIIGDITDHTNMAQAFAISPAIFSIGATIAPLYGGALAKPQDRWPNTFHGEFWASYPYFLPSLVSGCSTLLIFLFCAAFLKESLPPKTGVEFQSEIPTTENRSDRSLTNDAQPISMWILMKTYSVIIPILNYAALAIVDISLMVLLPLFYSSPIAIGGLGFQPATIGTYLAIFGAANGTLRVFFVAKIIECVGHKRLHCCAVLCAYPLILIFPITSAIVSAQGKIGPTIWILLVLQLAFLAIMNMSYTVILVSITRAAPNEQSRGATNGLCQSMTSIARAIGPAMTSTAFAISKEYNILNGNLIYAILIFLVTMLVLLSRRLPE